MFVFIDSSILCSDYRMKSINFKLIQKCGMWIVLSEIVVAEAKNKYWESLKDTMKKTNSGIKELNKLGISVSEILVQNIEDATSEYSDFLDMFIIESGMTIAEPYPNIAHNVIVERALARKKPFTSDGKNGYRDFLVWQTFLEFVRNTGNNTDFYFITQDKKDFSDETDEQKLHPDLILDIEMTINENKKVHYYSSLNSFVENVINARIEKIEDDERLCEVLLECKECFVEPVNQYVKNTLDNLKVDEYELYVDGENPEVSNIDEVEIDEILSISSLGDNEYRVQAKLRAISYINSFIFKSELAAMSNKEYKKLNITNSDWNKYYVLVENDIPLDIDVEIVLSIEESSNIPRVKLEAIEISNISDSSYCPYCPDYDDGEEED